MNRYLFLSLLVLSLTPSIACAQASEAGLLCVYASQYQGRATASGALYDGGQLTAAHASLPFGTIVRVANFGTGRMVDVRINDRKTADDRIITLSKAAAEAVQLPGNAVSQGSLLVVGKTAARTAPAPNRVAPAAVGSAAASGGIAAAAAKPEARKFQPLSALFNKNSTTKGASVANAYSYPDPNLSTQIPNQYGATSPSGMSLVSSTSGAQAKAGLVQTIQGRGPDVASGAVSGELIPLSASTATQGTMGNSQYAAGAAPRTSGLVPVPGPTMLASSKAPYRVQFGAFRILSNADDLAGMLKGAAVPVSVYSEKVSGLNLVVTDAGFSSAEEAQGWIDYEAARRGWVERPVVIR